MTTRRLLALLLVAIAVTVAVARSRTRSATPADDIRTFPVSGVVTAAPADGHVMISHDEIPGYMPAMTMPFRLDPEAPVPALRPGDRVRFTLSVGGSATLANGFETQGRDERVAEAVRLGAGSTSSRLRKGDAMPELALVTETGLPFTKASLDGHVTALTFIFTRCPVPDFCPLMVKRFQEIQRELAADTSLSGVRLVAATIDPEFDTPAVLRTYGKSMRADPARWTFVTGTPSDIETLAKAFAIHVERNGVTLDHTLATAVIDSKGRIVEIWRGNGWKSQEVLTTLRATVAAPETE
ncbi:MAG: SCO family protein [Acidobacteria bacterium]|nr:SCO family protein [Acidobacteriota bacterium]